jgi:hypothetical protein
VTKKGREKYGIIRYHSIPTETVYQSAWIQAFRQFDNLFRSIDSVSQTLLIIPLKKMPKNDENSILIFYVPPQKKIKKNNIDRNSLDI